MAGNFLLYLLTSTAITTALVVFLLWLTRTWLSEKLKASIKSEYDQKLETHKADLKAQTETDLETHKARLRAQVDIETEKLRSSLSIEAAERRIQFSKLHEERAEVVAKTYALLKDVFTKTQDYVKIFVPAGDRPRDERMKIAVDAHIEFMEYYPKKIIYLPKEVVVRIDEINEQLTMLFNEFALDVDVQHERPDTKKWNEIFKKIRGEIRFALSELEEEFRKLLGDSSQRTE